MIESMWLRLYRKDLSCGRLVRVWGLRKATVAALLMGLAAVASPAMGGQSTVQKSGQNGTELPVVEVKGPPEFAVVKATVDKYFLTVANYQDGDLIRQSQAQQALAAVKEAGWDVPGKDAIQKLVLADNSFLVKEFSTTSGRSFMRRVGRNQGAYNRVERLSTIAGGEQLIRDLVRQKDGDKLIEYMTTTPGGHNLGRMAANTRQGVDLNKPTGHIYTAAELVAELDRAYRAKDVRRQTNAK